ncbi:hypothetical protein C8R47DRAFT_1090420 [Mycena vitilis]|nr:hypothetical protein C8R47DRAFT_1090420 [Mycena vitilis]
MHMLSHLTKIQPIGPEIDPVRLFPFKYLETGHLRFALQAGHLAAPAAPDYPRAGALTQQGISLVPFAALCQHWPRTWLGHGRAWQNSVLLKMQLIRMHKLTGTRALQRRRARVDSGSPAKSGIWLRVSLHSIFHSMSLLSWICRELRMLNSRSAPNLVCTRRTMSVRRRSLGCTCQIRHSILGCTQDTPGHQAVSAP